MKKTGTRPYKRRNLLIKKGMQSRFVLGFTTVVAGGFVLNLLLSYYLIDRALEAELYRSHLTIRTTADIAGPVLWRLGAATAAAIAVVSAVIGYYLTEGVEEPLHGFVESIRKTSGGDLMSHRHAVSKKTLRQAQDRPFDRLRTGPPDRLTDVFHKAVSALEARFSTIKRSTGMLESGLTRFGIATGKGRPLQRGEAEAALAGIDAELKIVTDEINGLRV